MKNVIVVFICFSALLFFSCKKYTEDGKWSKNSVKKRIEHKWEFKECIVGGTDSVNNVYQIIQFNVCSNKTDTSLYSLFNAVLEFKHYKSSSYGIKSEGDKVSFGIENILYSTSSNNDCIGGANHTDYKIFEHKNKLQFDDEIFKFYFDLNKDRTLFKLTNASWDIKKMTDKELILETINSDNNIVRLKFNRL